MCAIALLTRTCGWTPVAATALGVELAAILNFFAHTAWTFRDHPVATARALGARFVRYQAANVASLMANVAITTALVAMCHVPTELASVAAVVICGVPN